MFSFLLPLLSLLLLLLLLSRLFVFCGTAWLGVRSPARVLRHLLWSLCWVLAVRLSCVRENIQTPRTEGASARHSIESNRSTGPSGGGDATISSSCELQAYVEKFGSVGLLFFGGGRRRFRFFFASLLSLHAIRTYVTCLSPARYSFLFQRQVWFAIPIALSISFVIPLSSR